MIFKRLQNGYKAILCNSHKNSTLFSVDIYETKVYNSGRNIKRAAEYTSVQNIECPEQRRRAATEHQEER